MNTKNKVVATLITLSAFMTLTACSVAPQADSFRDVGGITSNVTSDGTENPHDPNFATKAGKVVNEKLDGFVNSDEAKNAEETVSNSMNEETAKAAAEKAKNALNGDKANEIKGKVADGAKSAWDKVKGAVSSLSESQPSTSSANQSELASLTYESGQPSVISVNEGRSTLNMSDWKQSSITYSNLDQLNRVGVATAYLNKDNVGKSEGRGSQTWQPTGWKNQAKVVNGKRVNPFDRGHLIAYTLSFNIDSNGNFSKGQEGSENNPKNLATQTSYTNRTLFQRYEGKVRDELNSGGKVIYQVTPVFRDNELLPRGFQLQAISEDGSLNFNVYIYNVMNGLSFNYSDGSSTVDKTMTVKY